MVLHQLSGWFWWSMEILQRNVKTSWPLKMCMHGISFHKAFNFCIYIYIHTPVLPCWPVHLTISWDVVFISWDVVYRYMSFSLECWSQIPHLWSRGHTSSSTRSCPAGTKDYIGVGAGHPVGSWQLEIFFIYIFQNKPWCKVHLKRN